MTVFARFFVMTSSKNQQFSDFQFFMNRFNFLISLHDPMTNCYEKVLLELANRVCSFQNWKNTKTSEIVIFSSLWTPIKSLKFFESFTTSSQLYVDYGYSKIKWKKFQSQHMTDPVKCVFVQKVLKMALLKVAPIEKR